MPNSNKEFKSLLNELDEMMPERDKHQVIEAKADHFINSGIRLLEQIEEEFSEEDAQELTRRLFNSLKAKDFAKFQRKIRQINEENKGKK